MNVFVLVKDRRFGCYTLIAFGLFGVTVRLHNAKTLRRVQVMLQSVLAGRYLRTGWDCLRSFLDSHNVGPLR
jgi:hypothetical protein